MKNIHIIYRALFLVLFLTTNSNLHAQFGGGKGGGGGLISISGNSFPNQNNTETYTATIDEDVTLVNGRWTITGGGAIQSSTNTSVNILWTSAGNYTVNFSGFTSNFGSMQESFSVTVAAVTAPNAPGIPTIQSQNCTQATLRKTGSIPSGEMWYWQGTNVSGTSTNNPATSDYTLTATGTYYIRSKSTSSGLWGPASSITVTLGTIGGTLYYADYDKDGLGDPNDSILSCSLVFQYVANSNDNCPSANGNGSSNGCPNNFQFSSSENYIYTIAPQISVDNIHQLINTEDAIENIIYVDGLGRPKQNIGIKQSPNQKDIVTHIAYDDLGRKFKDYLPYASTLGDGNYKTNALTETNNYYWNNYTSDFNSLSSVNPNSESFFEKSPLNRLIESSAPGEAWDKGNNIITGKNYSDGHTIKLEHGTNTGPLETVLIGNNVPLPWNPIGNMYLMGNTIIFDGNSSGGCSLPLDITPGTTIKISYEIGNMDQFTWFDIRIVHDGGTIALHTSPPENGISFHEVTLPLNATNAVINFYSPFTTTWGFTLGNFIVKEKITSFSPTDVLKLQAKTVYNPSEKILEPELIFDNAYLKSDLFKKTIIDENWQENQANIKEHTTDEYKDKEGRVVLKRTYANLQNIETAHDTYYVYDSYGNLTYVIPPKINTTDGISNTELNELAYQYVYDGKNRLVKKKIPGKDWEYIIYDKLNRPVLTQDKLLRNDRKWLFTKYDIFGRVVYTGIYTHGSVQSQSQMQTHFENLNNIQGEMYESKVTSGTGYASTYYTNTNFPTISIEVLTVNYYDNYYFNLAGTFNPSTSNTAVYGIYPTTITKDLFIGSKVKVLETSQWITSVTYYDEKARSIRSYSKNDYLNATDIVEIKLDFVGKIEETTSHHTKSDGGPTITIVEKFEYDHMGRLKKQTHQKTGELEEIIVENTYDDLGQLVIKGVGGKTTQNRLQTVNYDYNVRGWLTNINDVDNMGSDLFSFKINYNKAIEGSGGGSSLFNGNISQTIWQTANDNTKRAYNYDYDALNRLTTAYSRKGSALTSNDRFSMWANYDKNGNLTRLNRSGHVVSNPNVSTNSHYGVMDDLTYIYDSGNKLLKVADAASIDAFGFKDDATNTASDGSNDYTYDLNGNLLTDTNKGITAITYNHLNLPKVVSFNQNNIAYIYDATGVKLEKKVTEFGGLGNNIVDTKTIQYAGNFIYEKISHYVNDTGFTVGPNLQFYNHSEGYVTLTGSSHNYVYQYKDHLGNVRLSYRDTDGNGMITTDPNSRSTPMEIIEESNYYPFGLKHKGYNNVVSSNGNSVAQKKRLNGKEFQDELGLNWHDFGARNYDASIGRWMNIDNLAEKFNPISPYVNTLNNPIIFADPDGNDVILKIAGERMKGYKKFVSTNAGRAFVSQFLKKGDVIPGTNIKIQESGKYSNETLSFVTAKVNKGKAGIFYKNGKNSRTGKNNIRNVRDGRDLQDPNSNFEFAIFLEKSDDIKSDEYAVIIGHESFVHHSESLDKLDNIRDKTKNGDYKSVGDLLKDIMDLGSGADKDHVKLSKDQIKLFINMVKELDKKEKTNKYTKMYEENRDSNK